MSKKNPQVNNPYDHSDLPKAKNIFVYSYRCFMKIFAIVVFGVGAMFLAIFVFPFIRLFAGKKKDFGIVARAYVSHTFRIFLTWLHYFDTSLRKVDDVEFYKNIHSKVIISNHPSLLDFVYIMSLVPNSTCIVRGGLTKTPLAGVIKQAYITNTTEFDDVLVECKKLIDKGCNVIIFPEGTRTPRKGHNNYKKGAARIALYCNCDVQPILIGGSDKYGLGKKDPLWSFNPVEHYLYDFKHLPVIETSEYKDLPEAIAAKRLTDKMEEVIRTAAKEYNQNPASKTVNNY